MNKNTGVFLTTVWIQTWMIFPRTDTLVFVGDAKASSTVFTSAGGDAKWPSLLHIWWEVEGFWCRKYNCRTCYSYPIWLANDVSQNNGGASFKPVKFFSIINHTFDHFGTVCNNSVHQLSLFLLVIDISCCWVTTKDFHSQFLWIGRVSHNCFHYCSKVCVRTLLM